MRDDFTLKTKEILAKRVAYLCSNPKCLRTTVGPSSNPAKVDNVGVAAHITAAAENGPRYDRSLTSEERRSITNGIWLCRICDKLVDGDDEQYTTLVLQSWKQMAEDRVRILCASSQPESRRSLHQQSSKILSYGEENSFGLTIDPDTSSVEFQKVIHPLYLLMNFAFYDTCRNTPYEDFVFLGSLVTYSTEEDDGKLHVGFRVDCHITHFLSVFQELVEVQLNGTPEELQRRLCEYPEDLRLAQSEFLPGELVPYRISRIGPKRCEIGLADRVRSLSRPFSTSCLLALLGQTANSGMLILDDFCHEEADESVVKYLLALNDGREFSLGDIVVDVDNPETFSFRNFK